ncbi:MAG TPA: hypothetical protein PKY30_18345, partial [Myxococcota bacterium]|nr:hypothetical protein [Myxococcota bacterium]
MEQTYYFTGGVKLTVDGRRLVGPCGGADLTRAEEQTLRSLLNHSTIGSAEEFSRVLSLGSGDRKFSAAYRRASNLRKVLEKVGAESIFPSRQWNFVPYGRGPSALSNLREWLAPSTKPVDILVALGTRNHRPFLPGAGLAQKVTSENLREIFRDWETAQWRMAKDAYRGLATDATFLSEITTTIARHHPTATIRSLPDVEVLAALANGEGTAVIALGMGNVNAVSARVVGFLQDEGICPRPFGSESNFLLGYGGEGLNDCNDS